MKSLPKIWNYIPALFILGALAGLIANPAVNEDYERYIEREGRLGGAAPYPAKPLSWLDCTVVGTTSRPEFWIE
jgi:hypothetical protein